MENGQRMVTFSIATSERWHDKKTGLRKESTEWHRIVVFNDTLGRVAEEYLFKGAIAFVQGKLKHRTWEDRSGARQSITEVVLIGLDCSIKALSRKDYMGKTKLQGEPDDDPPF